MRDDLLDAKACIAWAISDLPILKERYEAWARDKPYAVVRDFDSEPGKQLIRLRDVKPIPLTLNAEVGAILHSIRSSLDLLAVALAERNGAVEPKDVYFPIFDSAAAFADGAVKKIKRLSDTDRSAIENLKPYKGGNDLLFALHDLDRTRKHRRLLVAEPMPRMASISRASIEHGFVLAPNWPGFKEDAIIAITGADVPDSNVDFAIEIKLTEAAPIPRKALSHALIDFANLAYAIINLFDA
jgi:hypothetical protein